MNVGKVKDGLCLAATDFDSNALQNLNLQNVIDGGFGGHLIKTKSTQFDIFRGAGYNQEFSGRTRSRIAASGTTTVNPAVTQRNAEANVGETFSAKLGSRSTFNENFRLFFRTSAGPAATSFTFNTVLSTAISKWLGWQFSLNDNFLSNPPTGIKKNDLILSTGLRLTFGTPK